MEPKATSTVTLRVIRWAIFVVPSIFVGLLLMSDPFTISEPEIKIQDSHLPSVCFLVRTYKTHYTYSLISLVLSLLNSWSIEKLSSNATNFAVPKFFIVVTDPETTLEQTNEIILKIRSIADVPIFNTIYQPSSGNFGYLNTNVALREILESKHRCDYFLFTNGDNLFAGGLFAILLPYVRNHTPLIGWNWVSHYQQYAIRSRKTEWKPRGIELASAIISRSHLLRSFEYPYFSPGDGAGWLRADGLFWQKAAKLSNHSILLSSYLLVHQ